MAVPGKIQRLRVTVNQILKAVRPIIIPQPAQVMVAVGIKALAHAINLIHIFVSLIGTL